VWTIGEVTKTVDGAICKRDQCEKGEDGQKKQEWKVVNRRPKNKIELTNMYAALACDRGCEKGDEEEEEVDDKRKCKEVNAVGTKPTTRMAQLEFNEADVRKPLASARAVAKAGNGIWLDESGGFIMNLETGECMEVKVANDVYVFDVELDDKSEAMITLDSGAGCSVWPYGRHAGHSQMQPPKKGVGMVAANGTAIRHYGQRTLRFKGVKTEARASGFTGQM